jgi:pyruvate formate lyase activating enzyme
MLGLVSKIQDYSTKDGPGIRTTVFMIGCNLKCKWCSNPETITNKTKLMYHKQKCKLCGKCTKVGSNNSINIIDNKLIINFDAVTNIDQVVDCCPNDAYEKIGFEIDSNELTKKLLMNKVFYQQSNGGVTFSGGEALLQSEFVTECIEILHNNYIHVALDTAGNINSQVFKKITDKADLILFDIKTADNNLHKRCTDISNDLIIKNYLTINTDVIVRLIVVPGYNDNLDDIKKE